MHELGLRCYKIQVESKNPYSGNHKKYALLRIRECNQGVIIDVHSLLSSETHNREGN